MRKTDYVFDVHGGDLDEELVEFALVGLTGDAAADRKAEALARALSLPILGDAAIGPAADEGDRAAGVGREPRGPRGAHGDGKPGDRR